MNRITLTLASLALASAAVGGVSSSAAPAPVSQPVRTLGVTGIVGVINKTTGPVTVQTHEATFATVVGLFMGVATGSKTTTPRQIEVAAGQSAGWGVAVPWCTSQNDWKVGHYITVTIENPGKLYYVWQSNENWVDRIRFFDQPWWKSLATPIAGASQVDGNRVLTINPDGSLSLSEP
jgi:hypothetical protein